VKTPTLGGTVTVRNALWTPATDSSAGLIGLLRPQGSSSDVAAAVALPPDPTTALPMRFDVHIVVPSTLRIESNGMTVRAVSAYVNRIRLVANADLTLQGTYDRPTILGDADVERGEVIFEGNRYRVTRGSLKFANPLAIQPFFDVEAETDVRSPGQTYRVIVGFSGTTEQLRPTISSDPPLPTADVLALLFSDVRRTGAGDVAPELRAKLNPTQTQNDILTTRATQGLATPFSAEVDKMAKETFGVDTFQVSPSLVDPYNQQTARLNPTARVTIGKRISERVYLTYSRSLGTTINDQIVLLEYEENDRLSWILSRNEDSQTYALEFRVRRVF
jgi:translocation and assembly module TamB